MSPCKARARADPKPRTLSDKGMTQSDSIYLESSDKSLRYIIQCTVQLTHLNHHFLLTSQLS